FFLTAQVPSVLSALSLHDALPIFAAGCHSAGGGDLSELRGPPQRPAAAARRGAVCLHAPFVPGVFRGRVSGGADPCATLAGRQRSEEHTSELQSRGHHVCRLLLEK